MEKTLVHSAFTLDPSQFLDISQLLGIHLLSHKSQQKLVSTSLALKYENVAMIKPENQLMVNYFQSICPRTMSEVHLLSVKFKNWFQLKCCMVLFKKQSSE